MLVGDGGLVLQLPQQHVDEVGVFDDYGHLLKHVFKADAGLLQAGGTEHEDDKTTGYSWLTFNELW